MEQKKKPTGGIPHIPTDDTRLQVVTLCCVGATQEMMCKVLGITKPTLHKYYREELDHGIDSANANVASTLYQAAIGGNITAMIFWLKTRARWRENGDAPPDQGSKPEEGSTNDAKTAAKLLDWLESGRVDPGSKIPS